MANASVVLPVRIAEVYAYAGALADPCDGAGHHDLRISIKRLRYSLEIFAVCFPKEEVQAILLALASMQEYLGDVHDADVGIPEMQRLLGEFAEDRALALRNLYDRGSRARPMPYARYARELERSTTFPARVGLLGIINRMRRQRREAYQAAVTLWTELQQAGFRERLETLVAGNIAREAGK
jgi:hypothetical protein